MKALLNGVYMRIFNAYPRSKNIIAVHGSERPEAVGSIRPLSGLKIPSPSIWLYPQLKRLPACSTTSRTRMRAKSSSRCSLSFCAAAPTLCWWWRGSSRPATARLWRLSRGCSRACSMPPAEPKVRLYALGRLQAVLREWQLHLHRNCRHGPWLLLVLPCMSAVTAALARGFEATASWAGLFDAVGPCCTSLHSVTTGIKRHQVMLLQ